MKTCDTCVSQMCEKPFLLNLDYKNKKNLRITISVLVPGAKAPKAK